MEQLFTVKQVQQQLELGHTKVHELLRTGEIPSIKIGRSRRVTSEGLKEFIKQKFQEQTSREANQ